MCCETLGFASQEWFTHESDIVNYLVDMHDWHINKLIWSMYKDKNNFSSALLLEQHCQSQVFGVSENSSLCISFLTDQKNCFVTEAPLWSSCMKNPWRAQRSYEFWWPSLCGWQRRVSVISWMLRGFVMRPVCWWVAWLKSPPLILRMNSRGSSIFIKDGLGASPTLETLHHM